jgi:hypothetical protein
VDAVLENVTVFRTPRAVSSAEEQGFRSLTGGGRKRRGCVSHREVVVGGSARVCVEMVWKGRHRSLVFSVVCCAIQNSVDSICEVGWWTVVVFLVKG